MTKRLRLGSRGLVKIKTLSQFCALSLTIKFEGEPIDPGAQTTMGSFGAISLIKGKGKDIAVRNRNHQTATGNHMPYGITQCYLPLGSGDFPAFTPAEAGTRFSDPGGMQG